MTVEFSPLGILHANALPSKYYNPCLGQRVTTRPTGHHRGGLWSGNFMICFPLRAHFRNFLLFAIYFHLEVSRIRLLTWRHASFSKSSVDAPDFSVGYLRLYENGPYFQFLFWNLNHRALSLMLSARPATPHFHSGRYPGICTFRQEKIK